jgi:hypothetical protein
MYLVVKTKKRHQKVASKSYLKEKQLFCKLKNPSKTSG